MREQARDTLVALPLAGYLERTGFSCTGCGSCCGDDGDERWAVFLSDLELRRIEAAVSRSRESFAEPYHETVPLGRGTVGTFGWSLMKKDGHCCFYNGKGCSIYPFRPWICRTYPFSLSDRGPSCDPCPGTGTRMSRGAALSLAFGLFRRLCEENAEADAIKEVLNMNILPDNSRVLIDSTGVRVLHG
jgi:Fe-S-cluster containining protein